VEPTALAARRRDDERRHRRHSYEGWDWSRTALAEEPRVFRQRPARRRGPRGAASLAATFVVDRTDDVPSATACSGATPNDWSLRGAIAAANAAAGSTVVVPARL